TAAERVAVRPDNAAYVLFTSGSTGRPKGVTITHRAIVNRLEWMQAEYAMTESDVVVQKTPVTFDVSVWELFWPLRLGARIAVARPDGHRDPEYLAELFARESVSVAHFVPSMLAVFVAEQSVAAVETLRMLFASGEALPVKTATRAAEVLPATQLINLYGPTEAAVDVTHHVYTVKDEASVPIGRPVSNTQVFVLDKGLRLAPDGSQGELYLGGVQLARGYSSRSDLTAERFVANPFGSGRLYRTGDVVRWNRIGELEYIGRSDFQVKLRGQRIELGEIEIALSAVEAVAQAVVAVRQDQLVAWVVVPGGAVKSDLLRAVAGLLPAYMMPSAVVVLEEFPVTASGKLDRKALPSPEFTTSDFRAPSTPIEKTVARVFADVLAIERVGLDDDFFALGGNSLVATQLVSRLGAALDSRVAVRELFDASTVEALAARVKSRTGGRPALTPLPRPSRIPLSFAQRRMWFLNRLDPDSGANNIPIAIKLSGTLDVDALGAATNDVVLRHETLRTLYPDVDGLGSQRVLPAAEARVELAVEEVVDDELRGRIVSIVSSGFDVTREVPLRIR
ncbi:MAG: amino acid adenylation domain-containing protein, partial [Rhodococcus sp. (in: high G+C Gram-positive bacteria)]